MVVRFYSFTQFFSQLSAEPTEEQLEELPAFEEQIFPLLQTEEVKSFFVDVVETAMGNLTERLNPTMSIPSSEEAASIGQDAQKFIGELTGKAIEEALPDYLRPFLDRKDAEDPEAKSWREKIDENPTFAAYGLKFLQSSGVFDKLDGVIANLLGGKVTPGTNPGSSQPKKDTIW